MKADYLDATEPGAIEKAAALLAAGHLVVFPTDTLYGVGADAYNAAAIDALYRAKERPAQKGIPVLLADAAGVDGVARAVPETARRLVERFWPGPLTLVLPRQPELPPNLAPNENVAVRVPDHPVARALIRAAGGAVATSSANRSGEAPAQNACAAQRALGHAVAAILDGGPVFHGAPSTILDCTVDPPRLLRAGPLSAADLGLGTP
jgi:L-threonylcarbamoyladenylate synthase